LLQLLALILLREGGSHITLTEASAGEVLVGGSLGRVKGSGKWLTYKRTVPAVLKGTGHREILRAGFLGLFVEGILVVILMSLVLVRTVYFRNDVMVNRMVYHSKVDTSRVNSL
jgi:hypothetical protein